MYHIYFTGQASDWRCLLRAQVSLLVALLYLVLGGLRLGWACEVLSKPIISAFLTAGAMIISLSQVRPSHAGWQEHSSSSRSNSHAPVKHRP